MAASTVLGIRGANGPRLRQALATTNRYLLAFFNAYVKRDQAELAFLRRDPAANGAPAGLATIRELPAVSPPHRSRHSSRIIVARGPAAMACWTRPAGRIRRRRSSTRFGSTK